MIRYRYLPLIRAGLWRKPVRTILTMLSIVVAFLLFGVLHGVTSALDDMIEEMSDSRLHIQSRVNFSQSLPLAHLSRIERVPGVTGVAHYTFFGGYYQDPRNQIQSGAVDIDRMLTLYPELRIAEAHVESMRTRRTAVLVGRDLALRHGWSVGDRIPIRSEFWSQRDGSYDWAFDIVGTYAFGDGRTPSNELWINYDYFDEARIAGNGTVTVYFARIDDPHQSAEIAEAIDALFANSMDETQTQSEKDWIRSQVDQLGDVSFFVNTIIGAVLFTLLFVTGNTMMQSVRESVPELAVLKAYGFGNTTIVALVLTEAALQCIVAAALGLALAAAIFPHLFSVLVVGSVSLPGKVAVIGIALAMLLAIASALPPAWRAQRLDVANALAGR